MGMKVGYARGSTVGQKLGVQMGHLAVCDRIFREKASASSTKNRPELKNALDFVREEDVFVVTKLDRLARSVVDLSIIVQRLEEKNVDLVVMGQGSTPRLSMASSNSTFLQLSESLNVD
jgi:DNA invertase Pin-like site-specific DNA recombinase